MDNQHREIKGYRELNESDIAQMNRVKEKGAEIGELIELLKADPSLDQRWISIGTTQIQQGLMALTRAIAKPTFFALALLLLVGCAAPLKEVAVGEKDPRDGMHFIVNRDIVNTRAVTPQNELNGDFHCTKLRSAQEVAELRQQYPGVEFSRFEGCTPLAQHAARHQYVKSATGPAIEPVVAVGKSILYSATAAYVGHEIGRGIGKSGTTVNQEGGGAQSISSAQGGAGGQGGSGGSVSMNNGNTTTKSITQNNVNNVQVK